MLFDKTYSNSEGPVSSTEGRKKSEMEIKRGAGSLRRSGGARGRFIGCYCTIHDVEPLAVRGELRISTRGIC